jgi:hypothetical protein
MNDEKLSICSNCLKDRYLQQKAQTEGTEECCDFCENTSTCLSIEEIAVIVEESLKANYEPGSYIERFNEETKQHYKEQFGQSFEEVLVEILNADSTDCAVLQSVKSAIEDNDYIRKKDGENALSEVFGYAEKEIDDGYYQDQWKGFCSEIKHHSRFFSVYASEYLEEIFKDLERYQSYKEAKALVYHINPSHPYNVLYRARVADSLSKQKEILEDPFSQMGAPTYQKARAGRINPSGIPVFYASTKKNTCIKETRALVGSTVILAKFKVIGSLKILDLTSSHEIMNQKSKLDPDYIITQEHIAFLQRLDREFSKPVLPHEEEIEYLPTQASAEYLRERTHLDGVLFTSALGGKSEKNIAIFTTKNLVKIPDNIYSNPDIIEHESIAVDVAYTPDNRKKEESLKDLLYSSERNSEQSPKLELLVDELTIEKAKSISIDTDSKPIRYIERLAPDYLDKFYSK